MRHQPRNSQSPQNSFSPHAAPGLLVALEPRGSAFFRNLAEMFRRDPQFPPGLFSVPGEFWPDVLVARGLPWKGFLQSAVYHAAVIAVLWSTAQLWPQPSRVVETPTFHSDDVVYYEAPEYLAPLNTGSTAPKVAQKGDPELAAQPIISVPANADNRSQTIVAPPKLTLDHDVPLPNIVALGQPAPIIPMAATSPSPSKAPMLPADVVAPPPQVSRQIKSGLSIAQTVVEPTPEVNAAHSLHQAAALDPMVVPPSPAVERSSNRRFGDINIASSPVVAPAPQLPVEEQLSRGGMARSGLTGSAAVVPPPPSAPAGSGSSGRLIALNLHPATPGMAIDPPAGNRLGTFAATPQGKRGASGTPEIAGTAGSAVGSVGSGNGSGAGAGKDASGIPAGLSVGAPPKPTASIGSFGGGSSVNPRLLADASLSRMPLARRSTSENLPSEPSELERKVFGVRRLYTMTLNTPNLNSAGGSWVMHFAELNENPQEKGEVTAPVAMEEVDPGYPLELMRQNVQGTITLSAVIRSDGLVGEIHILNGVDDRLDQYACAALSRWKFQPGQKNGKPIALQAVVMIPFRPMRGKSGF